MDVCLVRISLVIAERLIFNHLLSFEIFVVIIQFNTRFSYKYKSSWYYTIPAVPHMR